MFLLIIRAPRLTEIRNRRLLGPRFTKGAFAMRVTIPAAVAALLLSASAQAATTNYPAIQSTIKYSKTATGASLFSNYARATSKVVYDSVADSYTLRDTGSLTTTSAFAPANIDGAASTAAFTVYKKVSGSTTDTFRRLNQSALNPLIVLSYVDYGQWRRATVSGGTTSVNDTYVVFGTRTATTPITGTGSYSTVLDGTFVNKTGSYAVSGTGTFNADFGSGTINYSSAASATPETSGTAFSFGTMTGSGTITYRGAGFGGTGATNGSGYAMDVNGNFYGPSADEIGGVFRIRGSTGNGEGAIVGN
jgi:hypothetical protein